MSSANPSKMSLWLPLIFWMALIFFFSTDLFSSGGTGGIILPVLALLFGWILPDELLFAVHSLIRKTAHFIEYAVLGLLWYRAMNPTIKGWELKAASWAFSLSLLYAISDEIHQTFTISRGGRAWDVIIDSSGALVAIVGIWLYNFLLPPLPSGRGD